MRITLFPTGRAMSTPSDRLDHKLTQILMEPSETRDRLGRGQYLTPTENNPHGLVNQALLDIIAAEPIFERICRLKERKLSFTRLDKLADQLLPENVITQEEADILRKAEASRLRTINVDEFEFDDLGVLPTKKSPDEPSNEETSKKKKAA